eukprot:SAG22_NODE_16755_length_318_cov_1.168950_1_plen_44_part_10
MTLWQTQQCCVSRITHPAVVPVQNYGRAVVKPQCLQLRQQLSDE